MTEKQYKVLTIIKDFIEKNGYSPRYHHIAEALGWDPKNGKVFPRISRIVYRLVEEGCLAVSGKGLSHNIRVLKTDYQGMNSCNGRQDRRHTQIWFHPNFCPMCELLNKVLPPAERRSLPLAGFADR